ncbi:hypothetical protein A2U01_0107199, partial [Trifolium medium]|nr:hypothetical protein [Trifolium medium]
VPLHPSASRRWRCIRSASPEQ